MNSARTVAALLLKHVEKKKKKKEKERNVKLQMQTQLQLNPNGHLVNYLE